MVRSIIGTILDIGLKKTSLKDLNNIIKKSNRIYAGPSAPAHGLFLTGIKYPENYIAFYEKTKSKVYNVKLFRRLLGFVNKHKLIFLFSLISVFGLSIFVH